MVTHDLFHIGNSAAAEEVARDLQMQEEWYAHRVSVALSVSEEAAIAGGLGTHLCICPHLKAHFAGELKAVTAVNTERRSAREERADNSQQVLATIIGSPGALAKKSQFQGKLPGRLVFLLLPPVLFPSSEIRVLEFAHLHVHFPAPFQIQEVQDQRPTD